MGDGSGRTVSFLWHLVRKAALASIFRSFYLFYFLVEVELTYGVILVSVVQYGDSTVHAVRGTHGGKSTSHLFYLLHPSPHLLPRGSLLSAFKKLFVSKKLRLKKKITLKKKKAFCLFLCPFVLFLKSHI